MIHRTIVSRYVVACVLASSTMGMMDAHGQLAPIVNSRTHQVEAGASVGLDRATAETVHSATLIGDIPWDGGVIPAQVLSQSRGASASAQQPLDTAEVGLVSRPRFSGLDALRASFEQAASGGDTASGSAASSTPAPAAGSDSLAATPATPSASQLSTVQPATLAPASSLERGVLQTAIPASVRATPPGLIATPSVDIVSTSEIQILGATETADFLKSSTSVQTVGVQRRSPIDFDPRLRGFHVGQVYTQSDGAYWFPARQDLDSMLSKQDPSLIQDVIVIPGPYGLRYGPGFGFIDIVTSPTPRYEGRPEMHARTGLTTRTNGGQLYGRETVFGGGSDWGVIFNYGNRVGSDYESGDNTLIPSSYQAQNLLGQLGFDTSEHTHWEFRYQRLDQTDTEYAGQFFDLNALVTDGYSLNYVNEDPCASWDRLQLESWYNRTRFTGDTANQSKRNFNVINRVESALGLPTDGDPASFRGDINGALAVWGARGQAMFGAEDDVNLRLGADFRAMKQRLNEDFAIINADPFDTNLPTSRMFDPGVFTELTLPLHTDWTTTMGARVDWVHASIDENTLRDRTSLPGIATASEQDDVLYAFYVVSELKLLDDWMARIGLGHAQRTPTLVERFADGVFLGIIQSGFSRVIGDPNLDKERVWQVDASTDWQRGLWQGRLSGFHSWVFDYVTYTGNVITDPSGARLLRTVNTDVATLSGAEAYLQRTLTSQLTGFASFQIVDGRDQEIDRPLASIAPPEGRAGLRLTDNTGGQNWGVEFYARMVDEQDRLGALRIGTTSVIDVIDLEERTPGFTVCHLRSYWNVSKSLNVVAGIDNVFDRNYLEHLNLRIPDQGRFTGTRVLEPGFAPYFTVEWTY